VARTAFCSWSNQGQSREIEGDRTAFCSWSTRRVWASPA